MTVDDIRDRLTQALRLSGDSSPLLRDAQLSPLSAIVLASLAATAVGAGLFAAFAILGPVGSDVGASAPDWTPPSLAVVELGPPKQAADDVEILSRPIFSKSRKPSPKPAKAAGPISAPDAAAPAGLSVNAIIKEKQMAQAFMVSPALPEGEWKRVGEMIDAWTVSRIERDGVVLSNGSQTTKVKIYADEPAPSVDGPIAASPIPAPPIPAPSPLQGRVKPPFPSP